MTVMGMPNILLIMTDQMRGDCLGVAGHKDVLTPHLDDLASKGVYFPNAYTSCPSCIAARAGLMTGMTPAHHGRVGYQDMVRWDYPVTLAGELSKGGYYTQCVGKMHVHPIRSLQGFHHIELHDGYLHSYNNSDIPYCEHQQVADDYLHWLALEKDTPMILDTGLNCNSYVSRPWPHAERLHPTNWVTDRSIDFLRRRDRTKPFFLMASYVRPHPPLDAPEIFFDLYRNRELTPPVVGEWADRARLLERGRIIDSDTGPVDEKLIREMQIGYYACISHVDNQIGKLMEHMNADNSLKDTLIIFSSDHGELLGDHHTFRKVRPYQGSVNIPMIISNLGVLGGGTCYKSGMVSDQLCELRDILPTCLTAAGLPVPESVDGFTMLFDNGREYIHGEHSGGDIGNQYIVTKRDKYCWFMESGREQYFRLEDDPEERVDRIDDEGCRERVDYLRQLLILELRDREEGYSDGLRLICGRQQRSVLSC